MATVVNNPPPSSEGSSMGMIVGIIIVLVIIVLVVMFGLPALRQGASSENESIDVNVPQAAPDVNIPDEVDVNVEGY